MSNIAFYAPIKPPDHHIASGDRLIARNTIEALQQVGHEVTVASSFIAYSKQDADEILKQRKAEAFKEADRVLANLRMAKPDLWLTYHPYCKAPDWIGPYVCEQLKIPYVTLEAAKTGQGFEDGGDRWAKWRAEAKSGLKAATLHLSFKPQDAEYLRSFVDPEVPIEMIKPFFDTEFSQTLPKINWPSHWREDHPVLITVAMMRPGKKAMNYEYLALALNKLQHLHWNAVIIGDGPEFGAVQSLFNQISPGRLLFTGALKHQEVLARMAESSLFIWPGWKEPIGMVYLEAQRMGLPIAAFNSMGVSLTVRHGKTGLLAPESDIDLLAENISTLISHPSLRKDFSQAAVKNILENHSLIVASKRFEDILSPLIAR